MLDPFGPIEKTVDSTLSLRTTGVHRSLSHESNALKITQIGLQMAEERSKNPICCISDLKRTQSATRPTLPQSPLSLQPDPLGIDLNPIQLVKT